MLQIKNLIQMCDEVSPIIIKKQSTPINNCRVHLDEDLMRASTKAHDPRKHLLIDNPKSVQQMLNPFKYKRNASREVRNGRTVSQDYFSFDDISVNNLSINTMLPINHIPCQDKYESYLREIQSEGPDSIAYSSYVRRYPKVYNYLKGQQQYHSKEPKFIIQPKRKEKVRTQIKQVEISTKIYNDQSNGKVQQICNKGGELLNLSIKIYLLTQKNINRQRNLGEIIKIELRKAIKIIKGNILQSCK
ncbi:hypothetical protein pb186bvf_018807 [Paramecium bursaria]